jgi:CheY-like chemotaxis protein
VTVASDGQQAVNILREKSFDLVLMDVQMPVMDGLTATATLREMEKSTGNHQRVVAMTAFAMTGDKDRCLAAGMDGYLSKPIRAQELDDLLEALIETKLQPSQANLNGSANSNGKGCVDAEELLGRIDGDLALLSELLNIFRAEYPEYLRVARESLAAGELEPLKRVAHTLRGSLANLSAVTASEIAARLENEAEQLDLESTGLLVNLLEAEIVKSVAALESIR